jgi:hypothetical protein
MLAIPPVHVNAVAHFLRHYPNTDNIRRFITIPNLMIHDALNTIVNEVFILELRSPHQHLLFDDASKA